jgi:hypothetical protein
MMGWHSMHVASTIEAGRLPIRASSAAAAEALEVAPESLVGSKPLSLKRLVGAGQTRPVPGFNNEAACTNTVTTADRFLRHGPGIGCC